MNDRPTPPGAEGTTVRPAQCRREVEAVLPYCTTGEHRHCAGTMTDGDGPVICGCTCHPASAAEGVRQVDSPSWAIRGDGVLDEYASERHTVTATAEPAAFFWDGERFAIPHVQAAVWQNTTSLVPHLDLSIDNGQGCESQIRMTIAEARELRDRLTLLVDAVEYPEVPGSLLMPDAQRVAAIEGFSMRHDGTDDLPVIDRSVQPAVDAWRVDVAAFRGWLRDREAQRRDGLERQLAGTPGSVLYTDGGSL